MLKKKNYSAKPGRNARSGMIILIPVFLAFALIFATEAVSQSVICGNVNNDETVDVGDAVYLIAFIFKEGASPEPLCSGDVNGDGQVNIGDAVYLVNWIFRGGQPPACLAGGELVDASSCKSYWKNAETDTIPPDQTCLEYQYDGEGHLSLRHINAGFNCCPGLITAVATLEGNVITIAEAEEGAYCDCNCLYDLDIGIYFLEPGQYTIRVEEPYLPPGSEPLEFTVDLTEAASGIYCVGRAAYPWGTGSNPEGNLVDHSTCKTMSKAASADSVPFDQDCVAWQHDGDNTLTLRHINAGFNCCPLELSAEFIYDGNTIIITENEILEYGGCLCLCLFDLDYVITGILPGEYTIRVNGMYLQSGDSPIEFTVDLTTTPTGQFCVTRDYYPWGEW